MRDTVTLGWEERLRSRGRRRSDGRIEFGTALPRGSVLHGGDCFVLDDRATIVEVIELAEPVFLVVPASAAEWGQFAYFIGNSHQPVMMTDAAIVCPDVPGMEQVLEQYAIPFIRDVRPFTPVRLLDELDAGHRHGGR
jgi:urease accessory protein UreE